MPPPTPVIENIAITGLILAGGAGQRMGGQDKGWLEYQGIPLIQTVIQRLRPQVSTLLISANRNLERYAAFGYPVLQDQTNMPATSGYQGPLAGILQGLAACTTPWLQIVPCDTPNFPHTLVTTLQQVAQPPYLAIVPKIHERAQWVFALLHKDCLAPLHTQFAQGERTLGKALSSLPLQYLCMHDVGSTAFENLNTWQPGISS